MSFARLSNYRQSPRKVRLVADAVRGMKVTDAVAILGHVDKRAADVVRKVLKSAETNALHNFNLNREDLIVSEIRVDEGATLKRHRPRARGRAYPIRKRTSHIMVRLTTKDGAIVAKPVIAEKKEKTAKPAEVKSESKVQKEEVKKAPAKKVATAKKEVKKKEK